MAPSPYTDAEIADELDALARQVNRIRNRIPGMTIAQLLAVSGPCPFPGGEPADVLLDLDTWAIVGAANLRGLVDDHGDIDLAG